MTPSQSPRLRNSSGTFGFQGEHNSGQTGFIFGALNIKRPRSACPENLVAVDPFWFVQPPMRVELPWVTNRVTGRTKCSKRVFGFQRGKGFDTVNSMRNTVGGGGWNLSALEVLCYKPAPRTGRERWISHGSVLTKLCVPSSEGSRDFGAGQVGDFRVYSGLRQWA